MIWWAKGMEGRLWTIYDNLQEAKKPFFILHSGLYNLLIFVVGGFSTIETVLLLMFNRGNNSAGVIMSGLCILTMVASFLPLIDNVHHRNQCMKFTQKAIVNGGKIVDKGSSYLLSQKTQKKYRNISTVFCIMIYVTFLIFVIIDLVLCKL
jgi:hypothetical protein